MFPEIWIVPRGIRKTLKPDNVKCTLFLHIAGEKATEAYNALTFTKAEEGRYNVLVRKFKEFSEDKKDLAHERYIFNNRDQKEGLGFLAYQHS